MAMRNSDSPRGHLPVELSTREAEENPQFVSLLQQLGQLLTPNALSQEAHKDLKQAEETLRHEKHAWLQSHILHREVREIILDYNLRDRDTTLSTADREFKEILEQSLHYAEAGDYLSFVPDASSRLNLLGLTPKDIEANNPYKQHIPSMQQKLIPELEDRLRKRCEHLASVHHSSILNDSSNLALAKASQLPALVETSQRVIKEKKERLNATREKREQQFNVYFKTLLDSLQMLEKMVKQYRLDNDNTIAVESLAARCNAMCLKIKSLELQILLDTYTAQTVVALAKVRQELKEHTDATERDLSRVRGALQAYNSVGFGFAELAEEVGKLTTELENKQWAINELAKSQK